MGKEGCVCRHFHHVGITLQACHEGGFHQGCVEVVPLLASAMASIFACKHLRTFAWIAVVAVGTTVSPTLLGFGSAEEPLLVAVVVLVHKVGPYLAHLRPQIVKFLAF